jgi:N-acetylneuraminate lyase
MIYEKLSCLIAATFTPYTPSGDINLDLVPALVANLRRNGVHGAFICGTTGESASLLLEEKTKLIETYAPYQRPDFKVIVMLAGTSQREAIQLAKTAVDNSLYGVAVTAPYYFRPASVLQLVEYLEPIAKAAFPLPLYFYHIPVLTRVEMSMIDFLGAVSDRIPNFAGIKYTHNDLMEFNRCLRVQEGRFDILWGWDELFLAGLSMGAKGAVGSTYNFAAPLYHAIRQAFEDKDFEKALHLQEKSIDFISLYGKYGGPAAGKAILKFCGLDCGPFRSPVMVLSPEQENAFKQDLSDLGFFTYIRAEENP